MSYLCKIASREPRGVFFVMSSRTMLGFCNFALVHGVEVFPDAHSAKKLASHGGRVVAAETRNSYAHPGDCTFVLSRYYGVRERERE